MVLTANADREKNPTEKFLPKHHGATLVVRTYVPYVATIVVAAVNVVREPLAVVLPMIRSTPKKQRRTTSHF